MCNKTDVNNVSTRYVSRERLLILVEGSCFHQQEELRVTKKFEFFSFIWVQLDFSIPSFRCSVLHSHCHNIHVRELQCSEFILHYNSATQTVKIYVQFQPYWLCFMGVIGLYVSRWSLDLRNKDVSISFCFCKHFCALRESASQTFWSAVLP